MADYAEDLTTSCHDVPDCLVNFIDWARAWGAIWNAFHIRKPSR